MRFDPIEALASDYPEYEATAFFDLAIPRYRIEVEARVLGPQRLTSVARYILKLVELQVNTLDQWQHYLGLEQRYILAGAAELVRAGLIEQVEGIGGSARAKLTERGIQVLNAQQDVLTPSRERLILHFDPLRIEIVPRQHGSVMSREALQDSHMYPLPASRRTVRADKLDIEAINDVIRQDQEYAGKHVTALLNVRQRRLEYVEAGRVFVLQHRQRLSDKRLEVYQGPRRDRELSETLTIHYRNEEFEIPEDAETITTDVRDLLTHVPLELQEKTRESLETSKRVRELEREIASLRVKVRDPDEFNETGRKLADLAAERDRAREHVANLQNQINSIKFLSTEESRQWLERALQVAQTRVIIATPWLNRMAVDSKLCSLIRDAAARGVRILIGYGYPGDQERKKKQSGRAVRAIEESLEGPLRSRITFVPDCDIHEKILVCDESFGINGSFNWLSYRGLRDDHFRSECSTLLQIPEKVQELAAKAIADMGIDEPLAI